MSGKFNENTRVHGSTASWLKQLRQAFPDFLSCGHLKFAHRLAIYIAVCSFNLADEWLCKALNGKS